MPATKKGTKQAPELKGVRELPPYQSRGKQRGQVSIELRPNGVVRHARAPSD
jgi:hypothetical protein